MRFLSRPGIDLRTGLETGSRLASASGIDSASALASGSGCVLAFRSATGLVLAADAATGLATASAAEIGAANATGGTKVIGIRSWKNFMTSDQMLRSTVDELQVSARYHRAIM